MTWKYLSKKIIKNGKIYSVKGFRPTKEDIAQILDIEPNAYIAKYGESIMEYRDKKFVAGHKKFIPDSPLEGEKESELWLMLKDRDNFTAEEIAKEWFPHIWKRGEAFLNKKTSEWSPVEREGFVPYDFQKLVTNRVNNYLYKFKEYGLVEKNKEESSWGNQVWRTLYE